MKGEQLRAKLQREGLFSISRKRRLPPLPKRIGIVTAGEGSTLQNLLSLLEQRCPLVEVLISLYQMQGEKTPANMVAALQALYASKVEVILFIHSEGTGENCWYFHDEEVARTVFASPVPIVTGVGQAAETTIVDDVADCAAPTPAAAVELVVPDLETLRGDVASLHLRLDCAVARAIADRHRSLALAKHRLERHAPTDLLEHNRRKIDELQRRMHIHVRSMLVLQRLRLEGLRSRLEALDPRTILGRGYALVRRGDNGMVVSRTAQTRRGDMLTITMHDGTFVVERT